MEQDILVSVIINCHNGDKYLKKCIESVISQTYQKWELILWDNCSNDNSAKIFKEFKESRFKYYFNSSKVPLSKARNMAAKHASGEWIAFLDSDDYWLDRKLEFQIDLIKNNTLEPSLVYSKSIILNSSIKIENSWSKNIVNSKKSISYKNMPNGEIFSSLIFENFIPLSSALISKNKYFTKGPINEKLNQAEDYDLFLKLSLNEIVLYSDCPQTIYRIHNNNLSATQLNLNFNETLIILDLYKKHPLYNKALLSQIGCKFYSLLRRKDFIQIIILKKNGYTYFTLVKSLLYFIYYYLKIRFK